MKLYEKLYKEANEINKKIIENFVRNINRKNINEVIEYIFNYAKENKINITELLSIFNNIGSGLQFKLRHK